MHSISHFRGTLYFEALLFILLGAVAIAVPQFFTIGLEILVGSLFLIAGIVQLIRIFQSTSSSGFWSSLISPFLNMVIGCLFLFFPAVGIFSLTYLLIAYFLFDGCGKMYFAFQLKSYERWGWIMVSGILSLLLAGLILTGLPGTAIWAIGLLIGINMLFFGFSLFALACSLPNV
jgi:uncharacterized membrane protein HdeD (DUF308 family)